MKIICKHCGTTNFKTGQCKECLKSLGSLPKALIAAVTTSLLLFVIWVLIAIIFEAEFSWLSLFFGFLISASILIFAHGKGPIYQFISTLTTIIAIFFSDLFVTWYLWEGISFQPNEMIFQQLKVLIAYQVYGCLVL